MLGAKQYPRPFTAKIRLPQSPSFSRTTPRCKPSIPFRNSKVEQNLLNLIVPHGANTLGTSLNRRYPPLVGGGVVVRGTEDSARLTTGGQVGRPSSRPPAEPRAEHQRPLRLLFVDDEEAMLSTHKRVYEHIGFVVDTAATGVDAIALAKQHACDAFLVDVHMAPHDGNWTCERLLELDPQSVVIMLSGVETDEAVLAAFAAGAVDYLFKGTSPIKIAAHIRRRVKEALGRTATVLRFGRLAADTRTRAVYIDRVAVDLPEEEARLFWFLFSSPGEWFRAEEIQDALGLHGDVRSTQRALQRLRRSLGVCGEVIHAAKGRGYRFRSPAI